MLAASKVIGFVPTRDAQKARAFYEGNLGFQFISDDPFALVVRAGETMIRITLLTKTDCSLCDRAKATIDKLTDEFRLTVELVALDSPEGQLLAARSGMAFPPAVLLDGQPFSYGRLSERKLRRALGAATT